jgi:GDP-mannose:di-myo-inositol-1,3'-phosphate beta-1,2-mannosyltransferase
MTRWNAPSGQTSHAEPIGHAWLEMGHELKVFAPRGLDLALLCREDEPFVHRCFLQDVWGQRERENYFFDPRPFLEEDYEIFLMEMACLMPMAEVLEIFPQIRKKARTLLVVHETGLPSDPDWYKFEWDRIVCFDERYKAFLSQAFPEDRISIIPFPCHPPLHGDKNEARLRLGLPLDKKIVFAYGFNLVQTHMGFLPVIEKLFGDYPVLLLFVTHHDSARVDRQPRFLIVRDELPTTADLYTYLHACDVYVHYVRGDEFKTQGVGVSSSVATCLGAGRPVLVPSYCNFFDLSGKEVIKYKDPNQLEQRLRDVFEDAAYVKESLLAAEQYATRNSGSEIAKMFLDLFSRLLYPSAPTGRR